MEHGIPPPITKEQLKLVSIDDLVIELSSRFETLVMAGDRLENSQTGQRFEMRRYFGDQRVGLYLCSRLERIINHRIDDQMEKVSEW